MKSILTIATLALASALVGCNDANKKDSAAPGAVSGDCCGSCDMTAAPGAVSAEPCGGAAACETSCTDAAPGAVSSDAGCASSCTDAAPGAVSSESDCSTSCSDAAATCPFTGSAG
jgi:hypothetical protein